MCEHDEQCDSCKHGTKYTGKNNCDTEGCDFACYICELPLTIEQIEQMDGQPVWVDNWDSKNCYEDNGWYLVNKSKNTLVNNIFIVDFADINKYCVVYRTKPTPRMATLEQAIKEGLKVKHKKVHDCDDPIASLVALTYITDAEGLREAMVNEEWEVLREHTKFLHSVIKEG